VYCKVDSPTTSFYEIAARKLPPTRSIKNHGLLASRSLSPQIRVRNRENNVVCHGCVELCRKALTCKLFTDHVTLSASSPVTTTRGYALPACTLPSWLLPPMVQRSCGEGKFHSPSVTVHSPLSTSRDCVESLALARQIPGHFLESSWTNVNSTIRRHI
jgi:hypothetical protein